MPVTTRSKRMSADCNENHARPIKKMKIMKLKDITNKTIPKEKVLEPHVTTQKSDSKLFLTKKTNVKSSQSELQKPQKVDESPQKIQDALNVMKKVKKGLVNEFKNVANRLQIDTIPNCLYDLERCQQYHTSSIKPFKPNAEDDYLTKLYLSEERHFQVFQHIRRNLISCKIFPGTEICLCILKEIMKYKSKDINFKTSFILSELHNIFNTIVSTFPPCHVQDSYLKIFTSLVEFKGLQEKKEVLTMTLDIIDDLIYENDNILDKSVQIDFNKNFYEWDMEVTENSSFTSFSRNNRFKRAFMVLDLLTSVLEHDMAIFASKYYHQFAATIKMGFRPLICFVIWRDGQNNFLSINPTVKKIISTYVIMVALKYPKHKIKVISRLLNIIINVMNMYEYPDKTVQYPINKQYTANIVNEIKKEVEKSIYYSMDLWIEVIENLRSSLIRMLLANILYSKIDGKEVPISLSTPYEAINSCDFLKFHNDPKMPECKVPDMYPKHDKYKKPPQWKISRSHYIKLLMFYTDAITKYFHLREICDEIRKEEEDQTQHADEMKCKPLKYGINFRIAVKKIDLNEKVSLRAIVPDSSNEFHIRLTKDDCKFYRNEIKNLPNMIRLIKRCKEKYHTIFDEWRRLY